MAEISYPYYNWIRSLNKEKGLYFSCNYGKEGNKSLWGITLNYAAIVVSDIYFYFLCIYITINNPYFSFTTK